MGNEANQGQKREKTFVTNNKTNNPRTKKSTIIVIVLLAIGAVLALTSWLIFGNVYELGVYFAIYIAVMIWSFLTGLYVAKQQRKYLWFTCIFVLLGATVFVLKFFNLLSYFVSAIYAFSAFLFVVAGTMVRSKKEHGEKDAE